LVIAKKDCNRFKELSEGYMNEIARLESLLNDSGVEI